MWKRCKFMKLLFSEFEIGSWIDIGKYVSNGINIVFD